MKLIYAVAGEGMGHATRSKAVLEILTKKYDVTVFAGDRAYPYLKKYFKNVVYTSSMRIVYHKNKVLGIPTMLFNMFRFPFHLYHFLKMLKIMICTKEKIVCINDFVPMASYAALLSNTPMITIDNPHIITETKLKLNASIEVLQSKTVIKLFVPLAKSYLITTFFFPKVKNKKAKLIPPILRKEIRSLTATKKEHILVYQTSQTNTLLLKALKDLQIPFMVYGFHKEKKEDNLHFKKEKDFFKDLASAKAVIVNGGFSVITESIYLKKPILCIPIQHQFEQVLNAQEVEKAGFGLYRKEANKKVIEEFINNLQTYEKNLRRNHLNYNEPFKVIEKEIAKFDKKN